MDIRRNYLSDYRSANSLVRTIHDYWLCRGYPQVRVWIEKDTDVLDNKLYSIRSNIRHDWR